MIIKNIFKIHPLFFIVAFIAFITGHFKSFVIFTIIILIHECGHIVMACFFKWHIQRVVFLPFGGLTVFNEDINRPLFEEFLILISGPIFQILFIYFFFNKSLEFWHYSDIILFFNLLPIYPLDGSRLVNIFLNIFISFKKSHLITIYISILTIFIVIFRFNFNLILILIISFILIKVIEEYKSHEIIFNRFLLERHIKHFNFKKIKVINDVCNMKRDYRHIFRDGKYYRTEREILNKRFDFHSKTW